MMQFDWTKTDLRLGFWFALVTFAVFNLAHLRDAAWMTAGLGALLAWLPILLSDQRNIRTGALSLAFYLVVGIVLALLAHWIPPGGFGRIIAVGIVAFAGALMLSFGAFWYLVGYVLVFWFVLSPLFSASLGLVDTIEGHIVGVIGISAFWLIRQVAVNGARWQDPMPMETPIPRPIVLSYAAILSGTMMAGFGLGGRILSADQTLVAQASLNIIAPSVQQTRASGIVRLIFGIGGTAFGFYIGLFFPGTLAFELVIALSAFVALAFLKVHMGFLVGAFAVMFSYPMGAQGPEIGHALGNEKLVAEVAGILLAVVAISLLIRVQREHGA